MPHTVNVSMCLDFLESHLLSEPEKFSDYPEFSKDVEWMKGLRNSIEHYEFRFTTRAVRLLIGRIVRGMIELTETFSLLDLEDEIGAKHFNVFSTLADEYEHYEQEALLTVKEAKKQAFRGVRPKHYMFVEWAIYPCPECNHTMIPDERSPTGYACTFENCNNTESEDIEVDCDICGCPWPNGEMTQWTDTYDYVCPRCEDPEAW
ncbi:MAG: hypothetical protein CMI12_12100 [Oceanospirillum sp.]|nr:hypothetical protein [Oceanospirillum sp.]